MIYNIGEKSHTGSNDIGFIKLNQAIKNHTEKYNTKKILIAICRLKIFRFFIP